MLHDVPLPVTVACTVQDSEDLKTLWTTLPRGTTAVDLGCGWGRLLPILRPYAAALSGVEPDAELRRVAEGASVPVRATLTERAEIGVVYQVLQHLTDEETRAALAEWRRWVSILVIMEKTDPSASRGPERGVPWARSVGRSVEQFTQWMAPWSLVRTLPLFRDARSTWMVFRGTGDDAR